MVPEHEPSSAIAADAMIIGFTDRLFIVRFWLYVIKKWLVVVVCSFLPCRRFFPLIRPVLTTAGGGATQVEMEHHDAGQRKGRPPEI